MNVVWNVPTRCGGEIERKRLEAGFLAEREDLALLLTLLYKLSTGVDCGV